MCTTWLCEYQLLLEPFAWRKLVVDRTDSLRHRVSATADNSKRAVVWFLIAAYAVQDYTLCGDFILHLLNPGQHLLIGFLLEHYDERDVIHRGPVNRTGRIGEVDSPGHPRHVLKDCLDGGELILGLAAVVGEGDVGVHEPFAAFGVGHSIGCEVHDELSDLRDLLVVRGRENVEECCPDGAPPGTTLGGTVWAALRGKGWGVVRAGVRNEWRNPRDALGCPIDGSNHGDDDERDDGNRREDPLKQ